MAIVSLESLNFVRKKVLMRCDFNVPIDNGAIADSTRIDASLATIKYVLEHGGAAVLCSHLGRPKERNAQFSLQPVAEYLSGVLNQKVALAPDCIGEAAEHMAASLGQSQALMLENLRFHPEEEANDMDFARELSRGKQAYINDAFGAAHREHASIAGAPRFFQERAAGFLMVREIDALRKVTENPERPYLLILGGAKVSDKIATIRNLMTKTTSIAIGGAMAYTFLKAQGIDVGKSLVEPEKLDLTGELIRAMAARDVELILPVDHVYAPAPREGVPSATGAAIPDGMMGLDIGPETAARIADKITAARTVVWNGPLGLFELPEFAAGTLAVGRALATSGAVSLIAGGDTVAAVGHQPWSKNFSHISTGGGATLKFLEGLELPGIAALEQ